MIILAVDLGLARTGLSVCDKGEFLASPLCVIEERNQQKLLEKVLDEVKNSKAEEIVLGLPRNMDGSEGQSAENARAFGEKLQTLSGISVILRDERLTTTSAHNYLNNTDIRGKKRKAVVDAVAATIILQDYLDFKKTLI
ncbi:MAG: Holliday junction resolvase RuvX [Bacillota bacterium]|nr:Holliday junction resolvase RuvX [Bacillota bacterium]